MLAACLLLLIAVLGGTMLTFLFDAGAPPPARIAMGACLGPALLASLGYLFALWLGLNAASIALGAGMLLLPLLLLFHPGYRARFLAQFAPRWRSGPEHEAPRRSSLRRSSSQRSFSQRSFSQRSSLQKSAASKNLPQGGSVRIGYWLFYLALAALLGLIFHRAVFERPDGIFTGIVNNLGDLPMHLQFINSFALGHNLPPEDPTYAGVRFAYPFLVDFLAAMLMRCGTGVIAAMWLQNMVMGMALTGSLHYWTLLLTRSRRAALLAPLLVLFSGGLGWWLIFSDLGSQGQFSFFSAPPHDYTILTTPDSLLRWGNSLTTLFVPQRSILFGIPLAIFIFIQWWMAVAETEPAPGAEAMAADATAIAGRRASARHGAQSPAAMPAPELFTGRRMAVAGVCAGLLPLTHTHTFLVVMSMAACLSVLFPSAWRRWALFFGIAIPLSLPEVFWLAGGVHARSYFGWQPGWDHGSHNILWFWFVNAGPFLPALGAALLFSFLPKSPAHELAPTRRLARFYAPFLLCFLVPNLVRLAPWVWDNIKVLFFWYIASVPLVALLLARWWELRPRWRWLAPFALASMTLAGGLDVLRSITAATEQQEFTADGIAIAQSISAQAAPRALVLHAPSYNTPVFLTGRRSLLGYPGWMWSRGLDYGQRSADIQRIYSGGADSIPLLRQYRVDYILVGPDELASFSVDERFLSQWKKLAQAGPYRLYQVNPERVK